MTATRITLRCKAARPVINLVQLVSVHPPMMMAQLLSRPFVPCVVVFPVLLLLLRICSAASPRKRKRTKKLRIGCGAGYAGDRILPAAELIATGELDYIFLECLAERTLAIAHARAAAGGELSDCCELTASRGGV